MNILRTTVKAVIKRPFILILVGLLMLAAAAVNNFIPVMAMIIGIVNMTGGGVFEGVLSVLQIIIEPDTITVLIIIVAVVAVLASILAGLLLPGYLLIVEDGIAKGRKKKGLFAEGLKNNFFRFFFMTLTTVFCAAFLTVFLMVASVPGIIVSRAAFTAKPELVIGALFIDLVTAGIIFMCTSFFRVYVYTWYIAAVKGEKKPFRAGKAKADRQFGSMTIRLLAFDLVLAAGIYLIYLSDSQLFRYFTGWAFTTAFFTTLAVYLTQAYGD